MLIAIFCFAKLSTIIAGKAYSYEESSTSLPKEAGASAKVQSSSLFNTNQNRNDQRTNILRAYLENFNSPLPPEAFITVADEHNLDWRLLPAISGAESTFGRHVPSNSYNPFGWNNGTYQFKNWDEAIATVGKALREKYMDQWQATTVEQIAPIYAPPSRIWSRNVLHFMDEISQFGQKEPALALNLSL